MVLIYCRYRTTVDTKLICDIKTTNISFENVVKFEKAVTNQAHIQEVKSRLNLGKFCYHSIQNL